MLYHPTLLGVFFSFLALIYRRNNYIFGLLIFAYPIIASYCIYCQENDLSIIILNQKFTIIYSYNNKIFSYLFLFILFIANLYNFGKQNYTEIILGSLYCQMSFLSLFAGDFISLFLGIELMLIMSAGLIVAANRMQAFQAAQSYFMTHLLSGSLILIGIAHMSFISGSFELQPLTKLLSDPSFSMPLLHLMFLGLIINVASFPFSGWMINNYAFATPGGFLYLMIYTTKLSIFILLKLFAGYNLLYPLGAFTIIYASFCAAREDNLVKLLCNLSVMQMGLMMLGIADGSFEALDITLSFLTTHILYKFLLCLIVVYLINEYKISRCSQLQPITNILVKIALIIGLSLMCSVPFTATYYAKSILTHLLMHEPTLYFIIIALGIATIYCIPFKQYFANKKCLKEPETKGTKTFVISLSLIMIATLSNSVIYFWQNHINNFNISTFVSYDFLKQILILIIGITSLYFAQERYSVQVLNICDNLGRLVLRMVLYKWQNEKSVNNQRFLLFDRIPKYIRFINNILHLNTQNIAIAIVLIFMIMMFISIY